MMSGRGDKVTTILVPCRCCLLLLLLLLGCCWLLSVFRRFDDALRQIAGMALSNRVTGYLASLSPNEGSSQANNNKHAKNIKLVRRGGGVDWVGRWCLLLARRHRHVLLLLLLSASHFCPLLFMGPIRFLQGFRGRCVDLLPTGSATL